MPDDVVNWSRVLLLFGMLGPRVYNEARKIPLNGEVDVHGLDR